LRAGTEALVEALATRLGCLLVRFVDGPNEPPCGSVGIQAGGRSAGRGAISLGLPRSLVLTGIAFPYRHGRQRRSLWNDGMWPDNGEVFDGNERALEVNFAVWTAPRHPARPPRLAS
jgi:hypothetical protein